MFLTHTKRFSLDLVDPIPTIELFAFFFLLSVNRLNAASHSNCRCKFCFQTVVTHAGRLVGWLVGWLVGCAWVGGTGCRIHMSTCMCVRMYVHVCGCTRVRTYHGVYVHCTIVPISRPWYVLVRTCVVVWWISTVTRKGQVQRATGVACIGLHAIKSSNVMYGCDLLRQRCLSVV